MVRAGRDSGFPEVGCPIQLFGLYSAQGRLAEEASRDEIQSLVIFSVRKGALFLFTQRFSMGWWQPQGKPSTGLTGGATPRTAEGKERALESGVSTFWQGAHIALLSRAARSAPRLYGSSLSFPQGL